MILLKDGTQANGSLWVLINTYDWFVIPTLILGVPHAGTLRGFKLRLQPSFSSACLSVKLFKPETLNPKPFMAVQVYSSPNV